MTSVGSLRSRSFECGPSQNLRIPVDASNLYVVLTGILTKNALDLSFTAEVALAADSGQVRW